MQGKIKTQARYYDQWLLIAVLSLIFFGLLMVSSASMVVSDREFHFPFYYLIHQVGFVAIGFVGAYCVSHIPLKVWYKISGYLIILSLLLLVLVLVPGLGRTINGSRRWIHLFFISVQVTELVKIFSILYLASYLVRFQQQVQKQLIGSIKPMLLLGVMAILLLLEPDFGTFVVISVTFLALLFISGVRLWPFVVLLTLVCVALALLAVFSPYRLARLTTFIDPWSQQFGAGYQLTQSLIAFGRGGLFGVGLGNSVQKLFYLPEAHTDFIFAVIGEELGLLGELFVVGLYTLLITRIFIIAQRARRLGQDYAGMLAFGIGFWLGFQAIINLGVSVGMLPTKGLTLPFISYGGSSCVVNCIAIALVFRIAYETVYGAYPISKKETYVRAWS